MAHEAPYGHYSEPAGQWTAPAHYGPPDGNPLPPYPSEMMAIPGEEMYGGHAMASPHSPQLTPAARTMPPLQWHVPLPHAGQWPGTCPTPWLHEGGLEGTVARPSSPDELVLGGVHGGTWRSGHAVTMVVPSTPVENRPLGPTHVPVYWTRGHSPPERASVTRGRSPLHRPVMLAHGRGVPPPTHELEPTRVGEGSFKERRQSGRYRLSSRSSSSSSSSSGRRYDLGGYTRSAGGASMGGERYGTPTVDASPVQRKEGTRREENETTVPAPGATAPALATTERRRHRHHRRRRHRLRSSDSCSSSDGRRPPRAHRQRRTYGAADTHSPPGRGYRPRTERRHGHDNAYVRPDREYSDTQRHRTEPRYDPETEHWRAQKLQQAAPPPSHRYDKGRVEKQHQQAAPPATHPHDTGRAEKQHQQAAPPATHPHDTGRAEKQHQQTAPTVANRWDEPRKQATGSGRVPEGVKVVELDTTSDCSSDSVERIKVIGSSSSSDVERVGRVSFAAGGDCMGPPREGRDWGHAEQKKDHDSSSSSSSESESEEGDAGVCASLCPCCFPDGKYDEDYEDHLENLSGWGGGFHEAAGGQVSEWAGDAANEAVGGHLSEWAGDAAKDHLSERAEECRDAAADHLSERIGL